MSSSVLSLPLSAPPPTSIIEEVDVGGCGVVPYPSIFTDAGREKGGEKEREEEKKEVNDSDDASAGCTSGVKEVHAALAASSTFTKSTDATCRIERSNSSLSLETTTYPSLSHSSFSPSMSPLPVTNPYELHAASTVSLSLSSFPSVTAVSPVSSSLSPSRVREKRHYRAHRSHDRKPSSPATLLCLVCPICQKQFVGDGSYSGVQSNFKRHLQLRHSSLPTRIFPCPYCDASFTTNGNRTRHLRSLHKEEFQPMVPAENRPVNPCLPVRTLSFSSCASSTSSSSSFLPLDVSLSTAASSTRAITSVIDHASTLGELCASLPHIRTIYRIASHTEDGIKHEKQEEEEVEVKEKVTDTIYSFTPSFFSWTILEWWEKGCPGSLTIRTEENTWINHTTLPTVTERHYRKTPEDEGCRRDTSGTFLASPPPPSFSFSSPPLTLPPSDAVSPSLLFQAYSLTPTTTNSTTMTCSPPPFSNPSTNTSDGTTSNRTNSKEEGTRHVFRCTPCGKVFSCAYTLYTHQWDRCTVARAILSALPSFARQLQQAEESEERKGLKEEHRVCTREGSSATPSTALPSLEKEIEGGPTAPLEKRPMVRDATAHLSPNNTESREELVRKDTTVWPRCADSSDVFSSFGVDAIGGSATIQKERTPEVVETVGPSSSVPRAWKDYDMHVAEIVDTKRQTRRITPSPAFSALPVDTCSFSSLDGLPPSSSLRRLWRCALCEVEVSSRSRLKRHQQRYCPFRENDGILDFHTSSQDRWMSSSHTPWASSLLPQERTTGTHALSRTAKEASLEEKHKEVPSSSSCPTSFSAVPFASTSIYTIDPASHVYASATALIKERVDKRLAKRKRYQKRKESPSFMPRVRHEREEKEWDEDHEDEDPWRRETEGVEPIVQRPKSPEKMYCPTTRSPSHSERGEEEDEGEEEELWRAKGRAAVLVPRSIACPVDSCARTFFSFHAWKKHAAVKHPSFSFPL